MSSSSHKMSNNLYPSNNHPKFRFFPCFLSFQNFACEIVRSATVCSVRLCKFITVRHRITFDNDLGLLKHVYLDFSFVLSIMGYSLPLQWLLYSFVYSNLSAQCKTFELLKYLNAVRDE